MEFNCYDDEWSVWIWNSVCPAGAGAAAAAVLPISSASGLVRWWWRSNFSFPKIKYLLFSDTILRTASRQHCFIEKSHRNHISIDRSKSSSSSSSSSLFINNNNNNHSRHTKNPISFDIHQIERVVSREKAKL